MTRRHATASFRPLTVGCLLSAVGCLLLAGCNSDIDSTYGRRSGYGAQSVNGTAVLADMFERAGHNVFTWHSLSPKLRERADCIVWFPDDFNPPSQEVRFWLEDWLAQKPGRTLIYVGRDFDAEPYYWDTIQPLVPPGKVAEVQRRSARAKTSFAVERTGIPDSRDCVWFKIDAKAQARPATPLEGVPEWLDGIDPKKTEIALNSRLIPEEDAEVLLHSKKDALVSRLSIDDSQVIVVTNGSFLLNLPLVNHEHRKLAGSLIDEIGPPKKTVVFLESGPGGPPIRSEDPDPNPPTGFEALNIWPTNWILLHLVIAGIVFCFARLPIFGRPRELEADGRSDFRKHLEAAGQWLARTRDYAYAQARLVQYQKMRDEGRD